MLTFESQIQNLKEKELLRTVQNFPISNKLSSQTHFNFNSNDYLALSTNSQVIDAMKEGADQWGVGSGGSRLLGKGLPIYTQFEQELSDLHHTPHSLIFNSGYIANESALSILSPQFDHIFLDRLCHASIIDGIRFGKTPFTRYPHLQLEELEKQIIKHRHENILVITETLFSMDGDQSNLKELFKLQKKYNFWTYIDQAHSFGAYPRIFEDLIKLGNPNKKIIIGTFGKAIGTCGAFITGPKSVIDYLINYARSFIYSTALSPAIICATQRSIQISQEDSSLFKNLQKYIFNIQKNEFNLFQKPLSQSHICPIFVRSNSQAVRLSKQLEQNNFYLQAIRFPTVKKGTERLRLSLNLSISWETTHKLLQTLSNLKNQYESS